MILKNIEIESFRAFKNFACDFDSGVNLVIGDNGAGKTSLLAAVTQFLSVQLDSLGGGTRVDQIDPHIEVKKAGDATLFVKEGFPIRISGELEETWKTGYKYELVRKDYFNSSLQGDTAVVREITEKEGTFWPLISYQRFDREWRIGKNTSNNVTIATGLNERRDGYKGCLSGSGQDEEIQKWCLKMSMMEFERKGNINEFDRFKHIIKTFLQIIEGKDEDFEISYSMEFSGLVMKEGNETQPLYTLSTGYKTILSMIMELAYRTVLLNPSVAVDNNQQPGIVIIDEIDAHLHPKWQWRVIDALTSCFPNVQYIIATHSPIIIASAKGAKIISLENKEQVSYSGSAYGFNVADVLDLKQGSVAMPKVSLDYMERLENALDSGDVSAAKAVLSEAMSEFGDASPVYRELRDYLEVNQWVENN